VLKYDTPTPVLPFPPLSERFNGDTSTMRPNELEYAKARLAKWYKELEAREANP
jgi:hypothetical protein